jgi:hypothetical protein
VAAWQDRFVLVVFGLVADGALEFVVVGVIKPGEGTLEEALLHLLLAEGLKAVGRRRGARTDLDLLIVEMRGRSLEGISDGVLLSLGFGCFIFVYLTHRRMIACASV